MSALLVTRINVRDAEKLKAYAAAASPTVAAHGGEFIARGTFITALLGDGSNHITGIMRFPSAAAITAWFASPEYSALAGLRDSAGEMEFFAYDSL